MKKNESTKCPHRFERGKERCHSLQLSILYGDKITFINHILYFAYRIWIDAAYGSHEFIDCVCSGLKSTIVAVFGFVVCVVSTIDGGGGNGIAGIINSIGDGRAFAKKDG